MPDVEMEFPALIIYIDCYNKGN